MLQRVTIGLIIMSMLFGCGVVKKKAEYNLVDGIYSKQGPTPGFRITPSGLEYQFIKRNKKAKQAAIGSNVKLHIITSVEDSVIFDSKKINNNEAVPTPVTASKHNGDLQEGFSMMHVGEIANFRTIIDSVMRDTKQWPPFAKPGDSMQFRVEMVDVKTKEEISAEAALATVSEDKAITRYIIDNKLSDKVIKTASGLYYIITKEGTGANAQVGETVSMNYTGYLLNGNVFDSNVDPKFSHVQPFDFILGKGRVIKGWDEGIALLNKGAKAKLIIPSRLGYGARAMGAKIPANSVLVFDVEMLGTK